MKLKHLLILAAVILFPSLAFAQGDGPRTYLYIPKNTNVVIPWFMNLHGAVDPSGQIQVKNGNIDTNIFLFNYHRTYSLGGHYGLFQFIQPGGWMNGDVQIGEQTVRVARSSGLGDTGLQTSVALVGARALAPQDYMKDNFRGSVAALFGVFMPTGSYDKSRPLNLGTNRWAFRLGLPMILPLGKWQFGKRTTIEANPGVYFYTDNNDIRNGQSKSQKPLYILETHVTRDLGVPFYVSFDTRAFRGGSTSVDGVSDDNAQDGWALGGTFGMSLSRALSIQGSYAQRVTGFHSRMIRFRVAYAF